MSSGEPDASARAVPGSLRLPAGWVSVALGGVLLVFFADAFLRDASPGAAVVLLGLGSLIVLGLLVMADRAPAAQIRWPVVAVTLAGTLLVGVGAEWLGLNTVLAAGIVGLIAGGLPRLVPRIDPASTAPLYVGAFAGMTSPVVPLGPGWLVTAGLITGTLWSLTRDAWLGIGGKMGTVAFTGVAATAALALALGHSDSVAPLPPIVPRLDVTVLLASVASALLTHWLAYARQWGPVLASALPVVVVYALLQGLEPVTDLPTQPLLAAWFGGGFVGMTSPQRLHGRRWLLALMALAFGLLIVLFQAYLSGLGGHLGATATAAVIAGIGVQKSLPRGAGGR